ncbi:MAG: sensor histidine kinase [Burkholderiales bacterium]
MYNYDNMSHAELIKVIKFLEKVQPVSDSDRKQLEEERRVHMMQQRTNLVREVHHRIKNNLQGVAGFLRQHAIQFPEVSAIIDQAISKVRAVAVVHGLQGQAFDNEVVLCEMVPTIAQNVGTLLSSHAVLDVCVDVPQRIRVNEQETVPIALIFNELIMNAAKHAVAESGIPRIAITVRWDQLQMQAVISIVNPGVLPENFDFLAGKGIGTGLDLVRSLLPPDGGALSFHTDNGHVKVILALSVPCIYNI